MSSLFSNISDINTYSVHPEIDGWDVKDVVTMGSMFGNANLFNQPIGSWNVSSVTNMSSMFSNANLFNQPIGSWNVSSVEDMLFMFNDAAAFNQDLNNWDVSSVTDIRGMFQTALDFNGDISGWDVSSVTLMVSMFKEAAAFNQNISIWNTTSVETDKYNNMFENSGITNGTHGFTVPTPLSTEFNKDIGINGSNPITIERTTTYIDAGAVAGNDVTNLITAENNVDKDTIGTYSVIYSGTKISDNSTVTATRTVNVVDTIDPVITSNLVSSVNDGETALGTVSADETVTWSVGGNKIISPSTVNIVSSSGNKYVFNGGNTYSGDAYLLTEGTTYTFENISPAHPMAILNNGKTSNISYSGDSDKKLTKSVTGTTNDGTYHFYYGTITVTVNGNFGNVSVYCYYHGYMGGQNILTYEDVQVNSAGEVSLKQSANYQIKQSYTYTIIATDDASNTNSVTKTVNVVDTTDPVITVTGDNPATVEKGTTYSDAGATADTGETVISEGTVDTDVVGTYTITYSATDAAANTGTATRTVYVVDTTNPVIDDTYLKSSINDNEIALGSVSANEPVSWSITGTGVSISSSGDITLDSAADYQTATSHSFTVTATDPSNNSTTTATLTVNVVDTTDPVITVTGDNPVTVERGTTYSDAGATADTGETVTSSGTVDTSVVETYTITYSATDAAGNTGTATRTVNVVDTTPPVITVTGDNPVTVEKGSTYSDDGATADTGETVTSSGTVDTSVVGTYTINYSATDAAENTGTATRTVNVVDTTKPIITSNLVTNINKRDTYLGTVSANETVTWSVNNEDIQIDQNGIVTLKQPADYQVKQSYTYTIIATDDSNNTNTITNTTQVYKVFTPETKLELQNAINTWYKLANGSNNGGYSSPLEYANIYSNPNTWNVGLMTDMSGLFKGKTGDNHPDIGNWNTCNVTTMESMFEGSTFNKDIGGWNVHNVVNYSAMFKNNNEFDNGGSDSIDEWTTWWTHKKRC
jgi:surface protein